MPIVAGNEHFSVYFFLHGPRLFHLSTEKVRFRSVGNRHHSGYSRADTINNNINKDERQFHKRKILKYIRKKNYSTGKIEFINAKRGSCLHAASVKSTVGNKLGFFLARFTFLLAHDSSLPDRSGATT